MENILMSNLNDFMGGRTGIKFWRSDGIDVTSSHGAYDSQAIGAPTIEILGTTSDTHSFSREFKLHQVPDRRIFNYGSTSGYWWIPLNMSADMTNAPNPSEAVTHQDNLGPTLTAVMGCLRYKIYTKENDTDSWTLKDTLSAQGITSNWNQNTGYVTSSVTDFNARFYFQGGHTPSSTESWQGVNIQRNACGRLTVATQMVPNIDECFIVTPNEGQILVKLEWTIDNTEWNNIFSRSYNEVVGLKMKSAYTTNMDALYSGERQYTTYIQNGYNN